MDSVSLIRHDTFIIRMRAYLRDMFPAWERLPAAVLMYVSFAVVLGMVQGWEPALFDAMTVFGSMTVFLVLLLLRLMDEIKDKDIDEALFPERPLPSGRVKESDIRTSIVLTVILLVAIHAWVGETLKMACGVLLYAALMYRFFFAERILRNSLPLTLLTHNPIVPLMLFLLAGMVVAQHDVAWATVHVESLTLVILQYWAVSFSWEISRKIRCAEAENAYVTYSRVFGRTASVAVMLAGQGVAVGVGVTLVIGYEFSWIYLAVLTVGLLGPTTAALRFLVHPTERSSRLRPFAEACMVLVMIGGICEYLLRTYGSIA